MFERILVPLDGSRVGELALPPAAELARAFGSEVITLHVCDPREAPYENVCRAYGQVVTTRLKRLIARPGEANVRTAVVVGKPPEHIVSFAEENDVGIIVMTCCGKSGHRPWSIGSTCNQVLQKAGAPTLVVRVKTDGAPAAERQFARVLVPLDTSASSEAILADVAELVRKLGSSVVLLYVIAPGQHVHTMAGLDYVPFKDHDIATEKETRQRHLEEARSKLPEPEKAAIQVRVGEPAKEIVACAAEVDATLIAMSSHGHSGLERWAFGSVAYKVLQGADRSILVHRVRRQG